MRCCKKCVQPDTRPSLMFDDEGVCMACRFHEHRAGIDWDKRENLLKEIANWARENSHGGFDCVVGVSGGKDSTFQSFYARDRLGLNPLLVNCTPDNITDVGRHNMENLVQHGFDLIATRTNPKVMRAITKKAFYEYGNPVKPSEYSLYAVSYIVALKFRIPLVIQGENPAISLGVVDNLETDDDAFNVRHLDTLAGCNASDWVGDGIELKDLYFFQFPNIEELKQAGIRAIFLNYYVREWSDIGNAEFAVARGLRGREKEDLHDIGRTQRFVSVDSDMQIVNQMLKYYKLGFGYATDEACTDIHEGRITREEAIKRVEEYDGKCGEQYIREFCEYIDISEKEFWRVTDRWVNKKLFEMDPATGKWKPKFKVGEDFNEE